MNNKGGEASPTITGISPEESWISRMCFVLPLFFWQRHELIAKEWSEHDRLEHHRDDGGAVTPLVVDTCWVLLSGSINMFQGCLVCSPICSHSFCLLSGWSWVAQSIYFPWIFPTFLYWDDHFCHARHMFLGSASVVRLQEPATIAGTIVGSFLSKSALGDLFFNRESGCEGWDFYRCHRCMK